MREREREREREKKWNIKQDPDFLETTNKVCCKATTTSRVCRDTNVSRQSKAKQTQQLSVKSSLVKCESDERERERERVKERVCVCVCVGGAGGHWIARLLGVHGRRCCCSSQCVYSACCCCCSHVRASYYYSSLVSVSVSLIDAMILPTLLPSSV